MESNLKPTILHLIASLAPGGTEHQLSLTIPRLRDFNHVIICLKKWGAIGDQLKALGFSVYFIPTSHLFSLSSARKVKSTIDPFHPQLMITYLPYADIYGRIWKTYWKICKLVCFLRSTNREWRYFPIVFLNNLTQCRVSRFFAVSNSVKKFYERWGLRKGKTDVIYNGTILDESPVSLPQDIPKISTEIPLLGYVAKLRKERGHDFLFQAMTHLKAQGVPAQLWLIGDGPYQATIEQRVQTLCIADRVTFLGYRKDIASLLRFFTLYVHPSVYEGMSNALLEAMVAGRPIITTDIPENRELIQNNIHGILVPPKNPEAMAGAIQYALDNPQKMRQLGDNARQRARETFNIDRTVAQLAQLLQKYVDRE